MSDTKELNNRLDYIEQDRLQLREKLSEAMTQRNSARADATHWRGVAREQAAQIERAREGLTDLHKTALQSSEDSPGSRGLAARVRQAKASVDVFNAATGGAQ